MGGAKRQIFTTCRRPTLYQGKVLIAFLVPGFEPSHLRLQRNLNVSSIRFPLGEVRPNPANAIVVCALTMISCSGEKVMAEKVTQVFAESLASIHETATPRPVVLLIITDGISSEQSTLVTKVETDLTDETNHR